MDFSQALVEIKDGGRLARRGWNGKGMWVAYSPGFNVQAHNIFSPAVRSVTGDGMAQFTPYLILRSADGSYVPWLASQTDILAEDWEYAL